jgi:B9 domain-containing protein 1
VTRTRLFVRELLALKLENEFPQANQEFDPQSQPFSYFYITINGQIDFGEFFELDGLAIRYNFVMGADWNLAGGSKTGAGQHSFKGASVKGSQQKVVWNLPFEVTFRSMTPYGWP